MSIHSVQKYIDFMQAPHSTFITMKDFSKRFKCIAYDPLIEKAIREQHKESSEYQTFSLERTDLLSTEERATLFKSLPISHT